MEFLTEVKDIYKENQEVADVVLEEGLDQYNKHHKDKKEENKEKNPKKIEEKQKAAKSGEEGNKLYTEMSVSSNEYKSQSWINQHKAPAPKPILKEEEEDKQHTAYRSPTPTPRFARG